MGRPFTIVAGVLLIVVAIAHALRIFYQMPVTIGTTDIPMWVSYVGVIVPGLLGFMVLRGK
jgi:hypothetical protein